MVPCLHRNPLRDNIHHVGSILLTILVGTFLCYWIAERFYGSFLERALGVDAKNQTPAVTKNDGRDFVPAKPYVLFAHHFAAIAGAGPIVGPTLGADLGGDRRDTPRRRARHGYTIHVHA